MKWTMTKVWFAPGEMAIRWGRKVVAYVDNEVAEAVFLAITSQFPAGPP